MAFEVSHMGKEQHMISAGRGFCTTIHMVGLYHLSISLTNYDVIDFFDHPLIIRSPGTPVNPKTLQPRAAHSQTKGQTERQKTYGVVIGGTGTERTHHCLKASSIYTSCSVEVTQDKQLFMYRD